MTLIKGWAPPYGLGLEYAKGDIVVTTDFDGTYDFRTISELLEYMAKPDVDIVTASPYHRNGAVKGVPQISPVV